MDSLLEKFRNIFLEEAQNLLDSYETDLLQLEKAPNDSELIDSAFRSMHTLKGTSGMYGFEHIKELTHKLESIFQSVRDKQIIFSKEIFDVAFSTIDHLRKLLHDENLSNEILKVEHDTLMNSINICPGVSLSNELILKQVDDKNEKPLSLWHILLRATEKQYFRGISFMNIFKELATLGSFTIEKTSYSSPDAEMWSISLISSASENEVREVFLFIDDDCTIAHLSNNIDVSAPQTKEQSILEMITASNGSKKNTKDFTKLQVKSAIHDLKRISVDAEKLDYLMFLASEFITLNSQFALSMQTKSLDSFRNNIEKLDTLSKQLRNNALELHLVPLSEIVLRFQRLVRDLSKQLGKNVEFRTNGVDIEIDKSIIDKLSEPLMHIIRNCIDHGIETPENRKKKEKPEAGLIVFSASQQGGKIVVKIEDDGNGIDFEKIRLKAISMGFQRNDEIKSQKELLDYIFMPGFSTAQSLTSVSGRGVGMDIVRKKIQELRGEIFVESQEGMGTSFTVMVQQSCSIVDCLLFKIEDSFFTIPISDINQCSDIVSADLEKRKHTSTIEFDNQLIPFVDLRKMLGLGGNYKEKIKLIVYNHEERMIAVLADKIIGEHQAVIKPLGIFLAQQTFLASASQLGDGNMAFMINTGELMKNTG